MLFMNQDAVVIVTFFCTTIRMCIFHHVVCSTKFILNFVPSQIWKKKIFPKIVFFKFFMQNCGLIESWNNVKCKIYKPYTFSQIWAESFSDYVYGSCLWFQGGNVYTEIVYTILTNDQHVLPHVFMCIFHHIFCSTKFVPNRVCLKISPNCVFYPTFFM